MPEITQAHGAAPIAARFDLDLLSALFDSLPDHVVIIGQDLRYLFVNRAAEAFMGHPRGAAVGRTVEEVLGRDYIERTRDIARRLGQGEIVSFQAWVNYPNGERRYVHNLFAPCVDPNGELLAYVCFVRNLTDDMLRAEKLAASEAALEASERINGKIIEGALDAFVLADDKGRIIDFNPAAEAMLGYPRDVAIGKTLSDVMIPHKHRAAHDAGMTRYMSTGETRVLGRRMKLEALDAAGELVPVEMTINEVRLPDRRLFAAHMRDLRPSIQAEQEIDRQRSRINQIEKLSAMGSLLAGVAHELNNPLAILVAQATLLKEKAVATDVRERAERIQAAADRAGRIIKSFLAMARQKPPTRERVHLDALVEETLEMLAYGLRTNGVEVARDLDRAVPALLLDGDMMRQVVANLVLNAQQALAAMDGPRRLVARTRRGEDHVRIEIEDNGPGVPDGVAERIFDRFFTTKPAGVGTGIGLAICRDIVQAHGGKIELAPKPTQGAVFRVTLPLSGQIAEDIDETAPAAPRPDRILVVDDERDVGESLGEILESLGASVVVTPSALEALDLVAAGSFDRVFVDLRMPEMSGATFLEKLAALSPKLAGRSVLMTGDTVRGPTTLLGGVARVPIMEKPFSIADVRGMLAAPPVK